MGPLGTAGGVGPAAASCGGFELSVLLIGVDADEPEAVELEALLDVAAMEVIEPVAAELVTAGSVRLKRVVAEEEFCDPLLAWTVTLIVTAVG